MSATSRLFAMLLIAACLGCVSSEQAATQRRFSFQEVHMGSKVDLTLYANDERSAATAARAAFDEINAWDQALSDYLPDSESASLPTIAGRSTRLGPRLAKAMRVSTQFHRASHGAFDPSLGRLTRLWRAAFRDNHMPSDDALRRALDNSGLAHVIWDQATNSVRFDGREIQFDFGAIGQGLAADAAMEALRGQGVNRALIDISGDILAGEAPPGSTGWVVQVEPEFASHRTRQVSLANMALCVSGDRGQPGIIDGRAHSHILDPKSGRPIRSPRQSVVIARDATTADAVATIACVMDVDQLALFAQDFPAVEISIERMTEDGGVRTLNPRP